MKKWFIECPYCKNEIKEGAIKCQYCWEFLDKDQAPSTEVPWQTVGQTKAVKKKSRRVWWIVIWIITIFIIIWNVNKDDKNNSTTDNTIWMKVIERMKKKKKISEWWDKLDKVECVWNCNNAEISIYLNEEPNKDIDWFDIDTMARWQAYNLTRTIGWKKAIVNIYVKWVLKEKCVTKDKENRIDYCEVDWIKKNNQYYE